MDRQPSPTAESRRLRGGLVALVLACAFSFGAIVQYAFADDYHVNCVGHGFLHGASQTDGSFFSRVEAGCGSGSRSCDLYNWGSFVGGLTVSGATCNAWSRDWGDFTECASTAHTTFQPYFGEHVHKASNWCG
jgi:hypothetical protein